MKFGSLFAGIGGLDLGLERAGMECAWQVEIDGFATKVLTKHWPDVPKYKDVRDVGKENLETVDLICGGFPCQPVSVAGKRKGDQDERWLWDDFYRIICEIKPKWVLAENVPGLLSANNGELFAGILRDLAEIGYDAEWQSIRAADVGAPHLRSRIFIVAHTNNDRRKREDIPVQQRGQKQTNAIFIGESKFNSDINGQGLQTRDEQRNVAEKNGGTKRPKSTRVYPETYWSQPAPFPTIRRVGHGVPNRTHRVRSLGNAVVPQVAEWIGKQIMQAANE